MATPSSQRNQPQVTGVGFAPGQVPKISLINRASEPFGDLEAIRGALQKFVDTCLAPAWGVPCTLQVDDVFRSGCWAIVFLDDADAPNALGYHDLTPDGLPLSKVFVRTALADDQHVSSVAAHELAEMLVDPAINLASMGPEGAFYAYEICDAVQDTGFIIDGLAMANFVYPSWFEAFRARGGGRFDHLHKLQAPFQLLQGGYMPVFKDGQWSQVFGSDFARLSFQHRAPTGRRVERRGSAVRRSSGNIDIGKVECTLSMTADSALLVARGQIYRRGSDEPLFDASVTRGTPKTVDLAPGLYSYRFQASDGSGPYTLSAGGDGVEVDGSTDFDVSDPPPSVLRFQVLP